MFSKNSYLLTSLVSSWLELEESKHSPISGETSTKTGVRGACRRSSYSLSQSQNPSRKSSVIVTAPPISPNFLFPSIKKILSFVFRVTGTWLTMAVHTRQQSFLFSTINPFGRRKHGRLAVCSEQHLHRSQNWRSTAINTCCCS